MLTSVETRRQKTDRPPTEQIRCFEDVVRKLRVISNWEGIPVADLLRQMIAPSLESRFAKVSDEIQKAKNESSI